MTDSQHKIKVKFLLLGFMVGFGLFLLLGAKSQDDVVLLAADRYRVSAWGDPHSHGAFIIDSLTGSTKLAYEHYYSTPEKEVTPEGGTRRRLEGTSEGEVPGTPRNHLGLPFSQVP